ncbi:SMP-30/gluconolactonase/LRE family protein [Leptospira langatensis]|uniref:SMP-30/gluconolactonase/LRE family protein n=1 Tax=Leptospira langatensis TaxID=2484983 RepID=A0A5F1ZVY7_9LEPT|nr:SMP-30/gluconolactonase/LRE family protein [Leptospira langatensis]TGK01542.1 SMP-30/gluconolactonase/LRE family protein [Leptospira langatensis]TGL42008.1 SMP-30/gluconolactonase/LRE family protein [Leptospira langatensis]
MLRFLYSRHILRGILSFLFVVFVLGILVLIGWNKTNPIPYSVNSSIPQGERDLLLFSKPVNVDSPIKEPFGLAVDTKGSIYTGSSDGNIYRIKTDGDPEVFAKTSGRPLGLAFDGKGNLVACVSGLGLAFYDAAGKENVLVREDSQGTPLQNLYGLAIAADGTVYFTEVSRKFSYEDSYLEELESQANGRILSYHPRTQEVEVISDGANHPTGIGLSASGTFLIYAEKYRHRISRLWLKGKDAGKDQFLITNLPGSPALISLDEENHFWIALSSPRHLGMDKIQDYPLIKKMIAALPSVLRPQEGELAYALSLSEEGDVLLALANYSTDALGSVTSVLQYGGGLILAGNSSEKVWKWKFQTLEIFF